MDKINLLELSFPELEKLCLGLGEKKFRARQIWSWLWCAGCTDILLMSDLPKALRQELAKNYAISLPSIIETAQSSDGTTKFLLCLHDRTLIETVLILEEDHYTQCLSTQVGCPMACRFCSTGQSGFSRNLSQAEVLGQVLIARTWLKDNHPDFDLRNLVFMGMGEPLLNLENVIRSLKILTNPLGMGFSYRRITVSTVGLPEALTALGDTGLASLAVSLHAPTQELRAKIMPAAAKTPLPRLMESLRKYPMRPRQRITFEYILLKGINDSIEQAGQLARLLGGFRAKINLIVYNPGPALLAEDGQPYAPPSPETILAFQKILRDKGFITVLRKSKGVDIAAACGQLRGLAMKGSQNTLPTPDGI